MIDKQRGIYIIIDIPDVTHNLTRCFCSIHFIRSISLVTLTFCCDQFVPFNGSRGVIDSVSHYLLYSHQNLMCNIPAMPCMDESYED